MDAAESETTELRAVLAAYAPIVVRGAGPSVAGPCQGSSAATRSEVVVPGGVTASPSASTWTSP